MSETLKCGYSILFDRTADKPLQIDNVSVFVSPFSLLVSNLLDVAFKATKYANSVRKLFYNMKDMFCNRESPHGDYYVDFKKRLPNLTDEIIQLYCEDNTQYHNFKTSFLNLFNNIDNFDVFDVRDRNWTISDGFEPGYRSADYRIEFTSRGKRRPELYSDLSSGTQDVFLLLLEIFVKRDKPLVIIEEIENGIHPSLYRKVLEVIDKVCDNKRALVTTHSPSVARHFEARSFSSFYVGIPENDGRATFAALDENKREEIESEAQFHGISIGELIIDKLSDSKYSVDELRGWLRGV